MTDKLTELDQQELTQLSAYPLGPEIRRWLGLPVAVASPELMARPDPTVKGNVENCLKKLFTKFPVADQSQIVDLLDELVAMDMPQATLELGSINEAHLPTKDFRGHLSMGVAGMLTAQLVVAERHLRLAQRAVPEEPAPYVNMTRLLLHDDRQEEALEWCEAGLEIEPNNFKLWELLPELLRQQGTVHPEDHIAKLAHNLGSWAGLSLAAEVKRPGDINYKLEALREVYHNGERSGPFLVEYTAALGSVGSLREIPPTVLQAEALGSRSSDNGLPWQLYLHLAQAYLGINQIEPCLATIKRLKGDAQLPSDATDILLSLENEALESRAR